MTFTPSFLIERRHLTSAVLRERSQQVKPDPNPSFCLSDDVNTSGSALQVISAHNLPKPQGSGAKGEVIDPYVVLELHGVPADCAEQRTRTAAQNQDDPLFDETFEFQVS